MRLHYSQYALNTYKALLALEASLTLDSTLKDLVKLRVSQINGCIFCVDMHVKEAKLHGANCACTIWPFGTNPPCLPKKNGPRCNGRKA